MAKWILAICFLFASPAFAQVGKDTGYWDFIKGDEKTQSIATVACNEGVAGGIVAAIDGEKYFLTAAHVVMKENPVTHQLTETPAASIVASFRGGEVHLAKVKGFDLKNDLCWLEVVIPDSVPGLEIAVVAAKEGDKLFVIGLGGLTMKSAPIRHWPCMATCATGREIVADTLLVPGDSGGGILNESGEVVGIVSGGWTWLHEKGFSEEDGRPINVTWPCRGANVGSIRELLGK